MTKGAAVPYLGMCLCPDCRMINELRQSNYLYVGEPTRALNHMMDEAVRTALRRAVQ